jgi:transcriptional regulator with XRE-family HTH domain
MDKRKFTPRAVLQQNLKSLMASTDGPKSQGELCRKSGVAQATIGRILNGQGENARIETVDKLAKAYGLEGWQILVAGMDPNNLPVLQPISKEERALYDRLKDLTKDLRKV